MTTELQSRCHASTAAESELKYCFELFPGLRMYEVKLKGLDLRVIAVE